MCNSDSSVGFRKKAQMDPDVISLVASCHRESVSVVVRYVYYIIPLELLPAELPGI